MRGLEAHGADFDDDDDDEVLGAGPEVYNVAPSPAVRRLFARVRQLERGAVAALDDDEATLGGGRESPPRLQRSITMTTTDDDPEPFGAAPSPGASRLLDDDDSHRLSRDGTELCGAYGVLSSGGGCSVGSPGGWRRRSRLAGASCE